MVTATISQALQPNPADSSCLPGQVRLKWKCKYCRHVNQTRIWKINFGKKHMNTCQNIDCSRNNFITVNKPTKSKRKKTKS